MTIDSAVSSKAQFLTAQECGQRYGFSVRHWHRLVHDGCVPDPIKFGRLVRWSLRDLQDWETQCCRSSGNECERLISR